MYRFWLGGMSCKTAMVSFLRPLFLSMSPPRCEYGGKAGLSDVAHCNYLLDGFRADTQVA